MSSSVNKIVLFVLIAVMAVAPLQGIGAAIAMAPAQDGGQPASMMQHAMSMHQQSVSADAEHCLQKCENCQQRSCNGHHQCQHAQCFSSSMFIPSLFDFNVEYLTQVQPAHYMALALAAAPSPLFRPPRA